MAFSSVFQKCVWGRQAIQGCLLSLPLCLFHAPLFYQRCVWERGEHAECTVCCCLFLDGCFRTASSALDSSEHSAAPRCCQRTLLLQDSLWCNSLVQCRTRQKCSHVCAIVRLRAFFFHVLKIASSVSCFNTLYNSWSRGVYWEQLYMRSVCKREPSIAWKYFTLWGRVSPTGSNTHSLEIYSALSGWRLSVYSPCPYVLALMAHTVPHWTEAGSWADFTAFAASYACDRNMLIGWPHRKSHAISEVNAWPFIRSFISACFTRSVCKRHGKAPSTFLYDFHERCIAGYSFSHPIFFLIK